MVNWLGRGWTDFKYSSFTDPDTREKIYQPTIETRLINHNGDSDLARLLVDSGAQDTLVNADIAILLGIDLSKCPEKEVKGLGGKTMGRVHPLKIQIVKNNETIEVPEVYFVKELGTTGILGQLDFFNKYVVQFNFRSLSFWIKKLPIGDDL